MKRVSLLTLFLVGSLLVSSGVGALAQNAIRWYVFSGGGGRIQSADYTINSTVGQAVIGSSSSASYQLGAGYWYGVAEVRRMLYLPIVLRNYS